MKKLGFTFLSVLILTAFITLTNMPMHSMKDTADNVSKNLKNGVGETTDNVLSWVSPKSLDAAAKAKNGTALPALNKLKVRNSVDASSYDGSDFSWGTAKDGCRTNQAVLISGLEKGAQVEGCKVIRGKIVDAYTGNMMDYVSGGKNKMDTEHIVARKNAVMSGLNPSKFEAFANDPLNLVMVNSSYNRSKQDDAADEWLPSEGNANATGGITIKGDPRTFDCKYVANQITVKSKYGLSVTKSEKSAMTKALSYCPSQKLAVVDGNNLG